MKPTLSVIIPTFNRAAKLDHTLECLHKQSLPKDAYEVWVVDDGSSDDTQTVLKKWTAKSPLVHALHQKNAGQGVARNKALKEVNGELVLFIGDDIYASKNFLKEHLKFHQAHPDENAACLGLTEWDTTKPVTLYMEWLTSGGPQFAYHKLTAHKVASFWFFYTSNISLKTSLLKKETFDEDFHGYGWEDIELGYRLHKKHQLELIYVPEALAYHDHFMAEESLKSKMLAIRKNARTFQNKHPEVRVIPRGIKKNLLACLTSKPILAIAKVLSKRLYWTLLSKAL